MLAAQNNTIPSPLNITVRRFGSTHWSSDVANLDCRSSGLIIGAAEGENGNEILNR
jgi:hypothetical protein